MLYPLLKLLCALLFNLRIIPIEIHGRENLKGLGGCVFVSNHLDGGDGGAVVGSLPFPVHIVLRDDWGPRLLLLFMTTFLKVVLITRGKPKPSQFRKLLQLLRSGKRVVIFPQGTRTFTFKALPGFVSLAQIAKVPVVPMTIVGTEGLIRATFWQEIPKAILRLRPPIEVFIHEAASITPDGREEQEVADEFMRTIASAFPDQRIPA